MAKQTKMAEEAAKEAQLKVLSTDADWDSIEAPEIGGKSAILDIQVGEVHGPLEYTGHQPMTLSGKTVTVHTATTPDGEPVRCPIGATFLRAIDQAKLNIGDTFMIRRYEDQAKKDGIGKGTAMGIFAIKVIKRVGAAVAA